MDRFETFHYRDLLAEGKVQEELLLGRKRLRDEIDGAGRVAGVDRREVRRLLVNGGINHKR